MPTDPIYKYADHLAMSKSEVKAAEKQAIYDVVNDLGLPGSTCEQQPFCNLLLCIQSYSSLLQKKDFEMSYKELIQMRINHIMSLSHSFHTYHEKYGTHTNTSVDAKFHMPQFAMMCGMNTRRTCWKLP